jgi:hypothetical protein
MATKLGLDGKFYYGTAGSSAATLLNKVVDVTLNFDRTVVKMPSRDSTWQNNRPALKDLSVEINVLADTADAGQAALRTAFLNGTAVALKALDASSGHGPDADFYISAMDRGEPLEGQQTTKFTAVISTDLRDPAWA